MVMITSAHASPMARRFDRRRTARGIVIIAASSLRRPAGRNRRHQIENLTLKAPAGGADDPAGAAIAASGSAFHQPLPLWTQVPRPQSACCRTGHKSRTLPSRSCRTGHRSRVSRRVPAEMDAMNDARPAFKTARYRTSTDKGAFCSAKPAAMAAISTLFLTEDAAMSAE